MASRTYPDKAFDLIYQHRSRDFQSPNETTHLLSREEVAKTCDFCCGSLRGETYPKTCLAISGPARTSCFTFCALRSACLYPVGQDNHQWSSKGLSLCSYIESQIDKVSNHFFVLKLCARLLIALQTYLTVTEVVTNFDGPFLSQGITLSYHSLCQGIGFPILAPLLLEFV